MKWNIENKNENLVNQLEEKKKRKKINQKIDSMSNQLKNINNQNINLRN